MFKKSELSYFIQMVDFCAYALLRHENESPLPSKTKYGLHKSHEILDGIRSRRLGTERPQGYHPLT